MLKNLAEYFGLESKVKVEVGPQSDLDTNNNTIYSILNDCRDFSIVKKTKNSEANLNQDEEIALDDFSNIAFNRSAIKKRDSSICLTVESKHVADLHCQDRTVRATKRPPSGCVDNSKQSSIYFEPSPPLKFQTSQNSHSISRIRSKSPNIRDTKTNFDEEFSRLFNGPSNLMNGESSILYNKSSAQTTKQSSQMALIDREIKEEVFMCRDGKDPHLELVQTSCFGGKFPLISMSNNQRNFSKERVSSISKLKTSKGKQSQVTLGQKENIHREQMSFISSKSRQPKRENSHIKTLSRTIVQDISQEEIESPNHTEDIEIYVPKGLRKKKKDSVVLSKVDHRREKSPIKAPPPVAVLDRQFKSAKIETFESVMQNLKGSHAR